MTVSAESGKCVQLAERVGECGRVEVASSSGPVSLRPTRAQGAQCNRGYRRLLHVRYYGRDSYKCFVTVSTVSFLNAVVGVKKKGQFGALREMKILIVDL